MFKNSYEKYGVIAKIFHWIMAFIILFMLGLGIVMTDLSPDATKFQYYGLHKSIGVLILILVAFRLLWRMFNISPEFDKSIPKIKQIFARITHLTLYILMFTIPLSGWVMSSSAGYPVSFFGLFTLPNFVKIDEITREMSGEIHEYLAYGLIVLLVIHVLSSLIHHFYKKDNTLKKMI